VLSVCILFFRLIWFLRCERLSNDSPQGRWDQINIKQRYGSFIEHGRGIRFEQHCKILITLKLSIFNDFSVCGQRSVLWWIIRWSVAMEIKMKLCYYSLYRAQFCFYIFYFFIFLFLPIGYTRSRTMYWLLMYQLATLNFILDILRKFVCCLFQRRIKKDNSKTFLHNLTYYEQK